MLRLLTELRLADVASLLNLAVADAEAPLAGLLGRTAAALPELSEIIARNHFAHAEAAVLTLAMRRREQP